MQLESCPCYDCSTIEGESELSTNRNIGVIQWYLGYCKFIATFIYCTPIRNLVPLHLAPLQYISDVCPYTCHIWSHWHQSFNRKQSMYISHISMNKYGYHIPNIAHMTSILCGHIYQAYLHIYAKTPPNETSTSHYYQKCARCKYAHQYWAHISNIWCPYPCMCIYEAYALKTLSCTVVHNTDTWHKQMTGGALYS